MFNKKKPKTSPSDVKFAFMVAAIASVLVMGIGLSSTQSFGTMAGLDIAREFSQSADCFGIANDCGNDNSVTNNNNNNPPSGEPATLTVVKEVECAATNGNPSADAVCDYAETSANFPEPSDYPITVAGSNPDPSDFPGSSTGTEVTIDPGAYTVTEELASTGALQAELGATSVITTTTATGDCTPNFGPNQNFLSATGTMDSGGSQTCTLVNTVSIFGGTVPSSP
jgi:hypothetical protein